jgi:hypothetical protein
MARTRIGTRANPQKGFAAMITRMDRDIGTPARQAHGPTGWTARTLVLLL